MGPTVYCVRHAQGYHNLSVTNHGIKDPLLTPYGVEQCGALQRNFPSMKNVDLIVASPLKRTLDTALLSFDSAIKEKGLKIIALPELQETSDLPCDIGSPPDDIIKAYENKPVDFGLVKSGWDSKKGRWAPTAAAIEKRARETRLWLMSRPEREIVVVSHGGFLHYFTEDWTGDSLTGTNWANTEFRTYNFSTYAPADAHFIETPESRRRRYGTDDRPLDHNEATQLKRTTTDDMKKGSKEYLDRQRQADEVKSVQAKLRRQRLDRRDDIACGYA